MKLSNIVASVVMALLWSSIMCSDNFRFTREIACRSQDSKGVCKGWNQTTILYRYSDTIFYCFPGDLYVLTSLGPLQMQYLTIDDQLFSLNLQTGRNQFTPVTAWLHRDPSSLITYNKIAVQGSDWKFIGSKYHNIAFSNKQQTDFKFLKDLTTNDTLISITENGQDFRVQSIDTKQQKEGLYSPFTQTGTFYIFPESFNPEQYKTKTDFPMILVHCLSQIANPTTNMNFAKPYLSAVGAMIGHYQPRQDEQYVNPIISDFKVIFGGDWIQAGGQKIAHRYSSYGSSYSSTRRRRQEERKRKTMAVLAVQNMLTDTIVG